MAALSGLGAPRASRLLPLRTLMRRAFRDARTRTIGFGYLFALYAYIQPVGYGHAYPTLASRVAFAHSFADNAALRLFYGYPFSPLTVGGYCAWRVGGTLAILAAAFGVLGAVRFLRTEEDTGRTELILSAPVGRGTSFLAGLGALAAGAVILWLAQTVGFLMGGLPAGESVYLALASTSVIPVYAGFGALASQLAASRRLALELAGAAVALSLLLRVIADTSPGASWLRWATPLGWAEEMRPFAHPQPAVLLAPATGSLLLLLLAARIAAVRDSGTGILPSRDTVASPRLGLLSSPLAQALRSERASLLAWGGSVGAFAFILGMVSTSVSSADISKKMEQELAKLGAGSIQTPAGYLSLVFIFFVLIVSLFACAQVAGARHEESDERLETLLSLPVARRAWLAGRLMLAALAAAGISLLAGLAAWAGAASQGQAISLWQMLEARANCLPVALLFLGLAALAFAAVPRASGAIAYGLVTVTFLWQLTGSVLDAPKWLLQLTPFAHVGLLPAQPFRGVAALSMLAIAAVAGLGALAVFRRRDLIGA